MVDPITSDVVMGEKRGEEDPLLISVKNDTREYKKKVLSKQNVRNIATLSTLWVGYFIVSAGYSIIAPFYPQEAAEYGVGSLEVGIIMGASPLCVMILSPIFGYFIPQLGLRFMVIAGSFLVGGSFLLLGFLIKMSTNWQFVTFSVLLRVTEGIGSAGYLTASFTIATILFPTKTGTVVGLLELGSGVGFAIGPPVGGLLYSLGGFMLPFLLTGGITLLFIPFFMCLLPHNEGTKQYLPPMTILKLLLNIPFMLLVVCSILVIAALGFFSPVLSSFLIDQFGSSEVVIGLVFLVGPLTYTVSSFLAGRISDIAGPRYLIIGGLMFCGFAFFLIGPAPFIISKSYLWLTCLSLGIIGISIGFAIVPVFSDMLQIARRIDTETTDEALNGIISGVSSSTFSIGEFIGPIMGGGFTQLMSFQMAAVIIGMSILAEGILLLGITLVDRCVLRAHHSVRVNTALN